MEELSLSLPEGVELQPVGTVSSIIQQLGEPARASQTPGQTRAWPGMMPFQLSSSRWKILRLWRTTACSSDPTGWPWPRWVDQGSTVPTAWTFLKCLMWSRPGSLLQVFEVFGPVSSPFYILRFNSAEQLVDKGLREGLTVYYAPSMKEYTGYILIQELRL